MDDDIKESLTATETWVRGLYMILFAIIYSLTEVVLAAVVIFQFVIYLLTRSTNERLLEFGEDLAVFIYQIIQFLTFNSEDKPFPFGPWPYGGEGPGEAVEPAPAKVVEVEPEKAKAKPKPRPKASKVDKDDKDAE